MYALSPSENNEPDEADGTVGKKERETLAAQLPAVDELSELLAPVDQSPQPFAEQQRATATDEADVVQQTWRKSYRKVQSFGSFIVDNHADECSGPIVVAGIEAHQSGSEVAYAVLSDAPEDETLRLKDAISTLGMRLMQVEKPRRSTIPPDGSSRLSAALAGLKGASSSCGATCKCEFAYIGRIVALERKVAGLEAELQDMHDRSHDRAFQPAMSCRKSSFMYAGEKPKANSSMSDISEEPVSFSNMLSMGAGALQDKVASMVPFSAHSGPTHQQHQKRHKRHSTSRNMQSMSSLAVESARSRKSVLKALPQPASGVRTLGLGEKSCGSGSSPVQHSLVDSDSGDDNWPKSGGDRASRCYAEDCSTSTAYPSDVSRVPSRCGRPSLPVTPVEHTPSFGGAMGGDTGFSVGSSSDEGYEAQPASAVATSPAQPASAVATSPAQPASAGSPMAQLGADHLCSPSGTPCAESPRSASDGASSDTVTPPTLSYVGTFTSRATLVLPESITKTFTAAFGSDDSPPRMKAMTSLAVDTSRAQQQKYDFMNVGDKLQDATATSLAEAVQHNRRKRAVFGGSNTTDLSQIQPDGGASSSASSHAASLAAPSTTSTQQDRWSRQPLRRSRQERTSLKTSNRG